MPTNDLLRAAPGLAGGLSSAGAQSIAAPAARMAGQSGIMKFLGKGNPLTMFVGDALFPDPVADGTLDAARARGLVR